MILCESTNSKHNQVADALSHKQVQEYIASVMKVESDFAIRIKESLKLNATH